MGLATLSKLFQSVCRTTRDSSGSSMANDLAMESRGIVRSYSFEAEHRLPEGSQAHTLGLALVAERETGRLEDITTPWRVFFEPNTAETELRSTCPLSFLLKPPKLIDIVVMPSPMSFERNLQSCEKNGSSSTKTTPKRSDWT